MQAAYVVTTLLAAMASGYAAYLNFSAAPMVKQVATRVRVPQTWMLPLGSILAAGSAGLLLGFAVPPLGMAAGVGLVVYFICALGAHARVRDAGIGAAIIFLILAVAVVLTTLAYRYR